MNINLAAASNSKKKMKSSNVASAVSLSNVFGNDSSDNDDGTNSSSRRAAVNQALKHEQDALRKRAQEAMKRAEAEAVVDDAAHDNNELTVPTNGPTPTNGPRARISRIYYDER